MSHISFINGRYVPSYQAMISCEDRGFQFADAVYEVVAVRNCKLIDMELHLARLRQSLQELAFSIPWTDAHLKFYFEEIVKRNYLRHGMVYLQISRGTLDPGARSFGFPKNPKHTLYICCKGFDQLKTLEKAQNGYAVITIPDIRWKRVDIKTVALLASSLAKQSAQDIGYYDALFLSPENKVLEGTSSNLWMITKEGFLKTPPVSRSILNGVTRIRLIEEAKKDGLCVIEADIDLDELYQAKEVFLTSANVWCLPIIKVDNQIINTGIPGDITKRLQDLYIRFAEKSC